MTSPVSVHSSSRQMTHVGMSACEKQNCERTLEPKLFATDFGRAAVRIRRIAHIGLLMDGFWTAFGRIMIRTGWLAGWLVGGGRRRSAAVSLHYSPLASLALHGQGVLLRRRSSKPTSSSNHPPRTCERVNPGAQEHSGDARGWGEWKPYNF